MIRKFLNYYRPHKKFFFLDLLAAAAIAGIDMVYPIFTRDIINSVVPNRELQTLIIYAAVLLALYFVRMGLEYFTIYIGHMIGVHMQTAMRGEIFRKLQTLPFRFFDNNRTGTLMSRIINDLADLSELAHHGPEDFILSVVMLVGSFIYLCTINVPLTLIIFAFIPLLVWFTVMKRKKLHAAFMETRVTTGEVNAVLENSISGIRVTKSFTAEDREEEKFLRGNATFVEARRKSYLAMAEFHSGMNVFVNILNFVVLLGGALFTYFGYINYGDFAAYLLFISLFLNPIKRFAGFIEQYQNGMTGFQRFLEIMDETPETDAPDAETLGRPEGRIAFEHVSFRYEGSEGPAVLDDVSFEVEAGKTLALVGPSGGGKTTVCHLIPRFYSPSSGRITVDGKDIAHLTVSGLRRAIGTVSQDVFLFTGSVRDNILYGNPDASDAEVEQAAKLANIHDAILQMPGGYDAEIGERGVKLSGGQKQRIAIARAFLKNPPILILDEATSALDNATEQYIQQSLEALASGRTTVVVAHRLSTIKNADEIIVITEDGIAERGSHRALLERGGVYASLYQMQFKALEE